VTALDPEAILRARSEVSRPRSRILSFLTGEVAADQGGPADSASIAPPSDEVRREMLRLQIEAERADLEAEAVALKADTLATLGLSLPPLEEEAATADAAPAPAPPADAAPAPAAPADAPEPSSERTDTAIPTQPPNA
jgi:hypothetical protein